MVKTSSKMCNYKKIKIISLTVIAVLITSVLVLFLTFKYKTPIKITQTTGSLPSSLTVEFIVNTHFESHFGEVKKYSVRDGSIYTEEKIIPVTHGYVEESPISRLKKENNIHSAEGVMSKFGSMLSLYSKDGRDWFVFDRDGKIIMLSDNKEYEIPYIKSGALVHWSDKYCLIRDETKQCIVDISSMDIKVYDAADFDYSEYEVMDISLKHPVIIDENRYITVSSDADKSVLFVHFLGEKTVKTIEVQGRVASLTLNDSGEDLTILTSNANLNDVFDTVSIFEAKLPNADDETDVEAVLKGSTDLQEKRTMLYRDENGIRLGDTVFFASDIYDNGKYWVSVTGINVNTLTVEFNQIIEELDDAQIYTCQFNID